MENDVLDSLEDLGYTGPITDGETLSKAVAGGPSSAPFTQLVEWLVQQIADLSGVDERVRAIKSEEEAAHFLLELSGFLREFGCPYPDLIQGSVNDRLNSPSKCLQLLDFLTGELQALRMIAKKKPGMLRTKPGETLVQTESDVAKCLKEMLITLGFPKPPTNITSFQLFSKLEAKVKELMTEYPGQIGKPLLKSKLSDKQWEGILEINKTLTQEYCIRREMLLKRLDVTIQSFMWSDKAKANKDKIAKVYQPIHDQLLVKTVIGLPEILAARDDLTRIQKTSSGSSRNECSINKILIGRVPDRGGRAWELEPPPPEMPSFMKRDSAPQQSHGARGGGAGGDASGRGGRVQGGWGGANTQSYGGQWDQAGGGFGGGRGGRGGGQQGGGGGRGYQSQGGRGQH